MAIHISIAYSFQCAELFNLSSELITMLADEIEMISVISRSAQGTSDIPHNIELETIFVQISSIVCLLVGLNYIEFHLQITLTNLEAIHLYHSISLDGPRDMNGIFVSITLK